MPHFCHWDFKKNFNKINNNNINNKFTLGPMAQAAHYTSIYIY